ncbi:TMAO reductase system periplasmic protein TorT [Brenneria goodwinii]|uniref:Periplasmic protein torT n=1 Tax=Brenneria goodwinii TaxID=1109412 RepID=A0A0G4JPW7_9GAMM|nr:TMAO reductase system periplasmic protein TorT [Brenneria goodwinii]MCG8155520.1 TMAO reductase system periplasmic protein TorT [Brenneria goodwinii]MCG8160453.1 TMAO reductase system periplasmic protein TorT [Brenneria goodwinii]MCG8164976.1 TMAO reductase system periplasmic protein TorT [Brenneria goodwinii]MCG8169367.1 TMAO reductase system periplasmic protein TorT [Brenneria goodwinii]MCG8174541.1 TMAO reductase system periplasmic protein TorT [Brenneria goodwinii]
MKNILAGTIHTALIATLFISTAHAADAWPPFSVMAIKDGKSTETIFTALPSAEKKWKLCVLLPHLKDSYWVGVDYGVVEEAKRLGASAIIYEAGGYDNLPRQIAQYDDCLASNPDAIIVGPISESGLAEKMKQSMAKGIPTVSFINPVLKTDITSKIFVDFELKGAETGKYLGEKMAGKAGMAGAFPGPQGSGWAESYLKGFEEGVKNSGLNVAPAKFGEASVTGQLPLVEDTLQSYPDMNALWGTATAAEVSVGAFEEAGIENPVIVASHENIAVIRLVKEGKISAVATEFPVMQAKVAVDAAIMALEKKPVEKYYSVVPKIMTQENSASIDVNQILAPASFQPTFSVN